ncbi:MAG: peroxiredoxin [Saprospiraceae bacterium]|nr:peroxiredoxin [Saprospiraceae bacterium]
MSHLIKGDTAPEFSGINQDSKQIRLSDFRGSKLILYFYPKDFTSGCTVQAENLSENFKFWHSKNYKIVGVSPDSADSHCKFREKHNIPFELIADVDLNIAKAYGVYGPKKMYGREYMGIMRTTFVIGENGQLTSSLKQVMPLQKSLILELELYSILATGYLSIQVWGILRHQ